MKYSFIKSTLVTAIVPAILSSCSVSSHSEKATGVNLNKYKTFAWAHSNDDKKTNRAGNEIIDENIKKAVSLQMEKKGLIETTKTPDVFIDYSIVIEKKMKRETAGAGPHGGMLLGGRGRFSSGFYSPSMGQRSYNVPVNEGQLTVNMVDSKTNKLVWLGWATDEINRNAITTKQVNAEVKSIFKKFDYPG